MLGRQVGGGLREAILGLPVEQNEPVPRLVQQVDKGIEMVGVEELGHALQDQVQVEEAVR